MIRLKNTMLIALLTLTQNLMEPQTAKASDAPDIASRLNAYNVAWDIPGPTSAQSMPIGNGDIGLNVWVEPSGDLVFYIGKTDAWSEKPFSPQALLKLGKIRVSMDPSPLQPGTCFSQILKLHDGEILIKEGANENGAMLRIWVDANHPVIRVEAKSARPVTLKVSLETWRTEENEGISADTIHATPSDRITWYHRNGPNAEPHVANLTFGAVIKGDELVRRQAQTLQSKVAGTSHLVSIYPLTAKTPTPEQWIEQLEQSSDQIAGLNLEQTRNEHRKWWDQFWHRSWIFLEGNQAATNTTRGYLLQRFVTACAGRGAYPIKFNGSIFNVDNPALAEGKNPPRNVSADYRAWGGQYWFQNTRAMYWPRLMAGDFELMLPLFKMYAGMLPANAALVKQYYNHEGAYFAETAPFWGGLKNVGPEAAPHYTAHYFTPILELSMMMLDYYEYTGDKQFARETLLPVATAGLQFFDKHFGRDEQGKIVLDPDNAIEMYWKVHNPAPDIAGLHSILRRMRMLPNDLVDASTRAAWEKMETEIPELPTSTLNGKTILLPYAGEQNAQKRNSENPELYAIYPFRIYGLDKPYLEVALATFNVREYKAKGCWVQDPIQAAMVGLSDIAKDDVCFALTQQEPRLKFPAFWARGHDYDPDQDNGGNGENGLQLMLMQNEGKKILLLPAWPKEWSAEFKLNAPGQTTVQGKIQHGKLVDVVVMPAARKADVIDCSARAVPSVPTNP